MEPSDQITPEWTPKIIFEFQNPVCVNKTLLRALNAFARKICREDESKGQCYRITFRHTKKTTNDGWNVVEFKDMYKESQ